MKNHLYRGLRWSERYFKTDMVYLARGGFWLTTGQIIASLSALLLAVAFANLVSKEVYGTYKYIMAIGGLLGALTLTGLATAMMQSVSRGFDSILKEGFTINLLWSLGSITVGSAVSAYYFIQGNTTLSLGVLIVTLALPLLASFSTAGYYLLGKKRFSDATKRSSLITCSTSIVTALALFFTQNVLAILVIYFTVQIIVSSIVYVLTLRDVTVSAKKDPEVIPYAKHVSVMNAMGIIALNIDKILVFQYLGTAQLALYALAVALPDQLKSLLKQLLPLTLPKFALRSAAEIKETMGRKVFQLGILILVAISAYIFIAPYVFAFLFPAYSESVPYSQLYALSLLGLVSILPTSALHAQTATKELYYVNTIGYTFQIITMFVGIVFYGLFGLIIARIIARLVTAATAYFFIKVRN